MSFYFISILVFLFGASVGSFINVIALRWNTGLSFIKGKSKCLFCNTEIGGNNLIPIFSFINLQGRCSSCKSRLSFSYFLVEVTSGIIALLCYFKFISFYNSYFLIFSLFIIFEILLLIFIYDLRHKIIPDTFVFSFIALSFLFSLIYGSHSVIYIISSGILVPLPFFFVWLFSGGKVLGFGDVKFMVGIGFLLGLSYGFTSVFISFWIGALVVGLLFLYKILLKRDKQLTMKSEIPFAPFLCLGTFLQFFFQFNLW